MQSLKKCFAPYWAAVAFCCVLLYAAPLTAQNRVALVGSGSNVPIHLYTAWTDEFNKRNDHIQVRYLSLSTVEGIKQISEGSGDFAAGEIPLSDEQMHGAKLSLMNVPTVLVGIVPIYNLPGQPEVHFSGEVLAQMFMGNIKNWKDARIAKLNPGTNLPDLPVKVVHRTPGKGSNYIFTDFLSKTSPEFRSQIGKNASPKWPLGDDANRNDDMVEKVAAAPGAVGYVELNFARRSDIGYGDVMNPAGRFIKASPQTITSACAAMEKSIPKDFRISLTNAPGKDSYPISSFTWLYVPTSGLSGERSQALKDYLKWAYGDGQNIARSLGYAPLPSALLSKAKTAISAVQ